MRSRALRGLLTGLLVGALLAVTGCTDPSAPAYVEVTDGGLTAVRPAAWNTPTPVDPPWTQGFRSGPQSVEQIQFSPDFGEHATAAEAMGTLIGRGQVALAEFTVVETRDVEVKGATTAQVVRYTITDNAGSQVSGEWMVAAHWPYPQSMAISILTPRYDPDLERAVLESMRMKPELS